jgi:hypothetical protein
LIACIAAFVVCIPLALCAAVLADAPLTPLSVLPFLALGFATIGESSNIMSTRRWFVLAIGITLSLFALLTAAWGLLAKSLISDIGASLY